jgi:tetratricopeptide (TPR) repeat protein
MSDADDKATRADALEEEGNLDEAIRTWRQLHEEEPRPEYAYRLGSALLTRGEYDEAELHLTAAVRGAPDMAEPRFRLGSLFLKKKRLQEARAMLEQGLRITEWPPAFNLLGSVCRSLGDKAGALAAFERAVSLDPSDDEALYGLGVELQTTHPGRSEELFRQALSIDPESAAARRELGFMLWKRGRHEEAEGEVRRSLESDYSNPWAHVYLGNLLMFRGALDEAEMEFKAALLIWPDMLVACSHLGQVLARQERREEAERLFRRVLVSDPLHYTSNLELGRVLIRQGRVQEARPFIERALAEKPSSKQARAALAELERIESGQ